MNELMEKVESWPDGEVIYRQVWIGEVGEWRKFRTSVTTDDLKALVTRLRGAEARVERLREAAKQAAWKRDGAYYAPEFGYKKGFDAGWNAHAAREALAEGERQTFSSEEAHG